VVETQAHVFSAVPFDSFQFFRSTDLDESRALIAQVFSEHTLSVRGQAQRFAAEMDHVPVGSFSLSRLSWGAPVHVDPQRLGNYYLICLPVSGEAKFNLNGRPTDVSTRCAGVVNASERFHFDANADFDQIAIRVERTAVEKGWQALMGTPVSSPISFDCALPASSTAWSTLAPLSQMFAQRIGCSNSLFQRRLEEHFINALLLSQPHSHRVALDSTPSSPNTPALVRRAQRVLLERADIEIGTGIGPTVSEIAIACGVSVRTLQLAFHDAYGIGPMAWLKRERLGEVRVALRGNPEVSITNIATQAGFSHLGDFSQAYRRAFGETPSATRRRD
jgi:AraC-like DNA-binding protein